MGGRAREPTLRDRARERMNDSTVKETNGATRSVWPARPSGESSRGGGGKWSAGMSTRVDIL